VIDECEDLHGCPGFPSACPVWRQRCGGFRWRRCHCW
jgi:hypothetical protein